MKTYEQLLDERRTIDSQMNRLYAEYYNSSEGLERYDLLENVKIDKFIVKGNLEYYNSLISEKKRLELIIRRYYSDDISTDDLKIVNETSEQLDEIDTKLSKLFDEKNPIIKNYFAII